MIFTEKNMYTYDAIIHYSHTIEERKELVDKKCLVPHIHMNVKVSFKLEYPKWIDFKTIKDKIEKHVLKTFRGKIPVDRELEIDEEQLRKETYENNIGKKDTETILTEMTDLFTINFPEMLYGKIKLQETKRYGMEKEICRST